MLYAHQADALCAQAVAVEEMIASHDPDAPKEREELREHWSRLADQLARSAPPEGHEAAQHRLVFGLRSGLAAEAHAAILNLQAAMPECFGLPALDQPGPDALLAIGQEDAAASASEAEPEAALTRVSADGPSGAPDAAGEEVINAVTAMHFGVAGGVVLMGVAAVAAGVSVVSRRTRWRRATRYACSIPADIAAPSSAGAGRLTNISVYGAQVQRLAFDAQTGDQIRITTPLLEASAEVMWTNNHFIGVKFLYPIDPYTISLAIKFRGR